MRTNLIMAVLALPMMAVPAAAQQTSSTNQSPSAKSAEAKEKKYCFKYEDATGSRIKSEACKTKAQWAKEGIEVGK